ncbi:MAG: hypothetical protein EP329_14560 [Deltaproteobacteria bacterium]|nr:MAG: hypothetical protein EP329_14560 [Deltaproteobacteria bacterium]
MIGDNAAIAVLGPTGADAERARTLAESVGAELARLGYTVVVHGDGTTARAATSGARANGGQVQAIVWPGADKTPMPGAEKAREPDTLRAMARVLELADALVLVPGGVETTSVLLQIWLYAFTPQAPYRQTVLVGEEWPKTLAALADALHLDPRTRATVTFAREATEAVESLRYYVRPTSQP